MPYGTMVQRSRTPGGRGTHRRSAGRRPGSVVLAGAPGAATAGRAARPRRPNQVVVVRQDHRDRPLQSEVAQLARRVGEVKMHQIRPKVPKEAGNSGLIGVIATVASVPAPTIVTRPGRPPGCAAGGVHQHGALEIGLQAVHQEFDGPLHTARRRPVVLEDVEHSGSRHRARAWASDAVSCRDTRRSGGVPSTMVRHNAPRSACPADVMAVHPCKPAGLGGVGNSKRVAWRQSGQDDRSWGCRAGRGGVRWRERARWNPPRAARPGRGGAAGPARRSPASSASLGRERAALDTGAGGRRRPAVLSGAAAAARARGAGWRWWPWRSPRDRPA